MYETKTYSRGYCKTILYIGQYNILDPWNKNQICTHVMYIHRILGTVPLHSLINTRGKLLYLFVTAMTGTYIQPIIHLKSIQLLRIHWWWIYNSECTLKRISNFYVDDFLNHIYIWLYLFIWLHVIQKKKTITMYDKRILHLNVHIQLFIRFILLYL